MQVKETETSFIVSGRVECDKCKGTGLYVGVCERGGAAVICYCCKGTGAVDVEYHFNKFTERKLRDSVKRVFDNCGFCISAHNVEVDGKILKFEEAGASYDEWLAGKKPLPIKDLYCPFLHTNQSLDRDSELYTTRCAKGLGCGSSRISDCKHFGDKATCWAMFEDECESP